jgi:hypothetical protein
MLKGAQIIIKLQKWRFFCKNAKQICCEIRILPNKTKVKARCDVQKQMAITFGSIQSKESN